MKDDIPSNLKTEVLYSAPKLEWEWGHLGSSHGHGQMRGYMQQTLGEGIAVRPYSENFGVAVSIMMLQKLPHSEGAKNECQMGPASGPTVRGQANALALIKSSAILSLGVMAHSNWGI